MRSDSSWHLLGSPAGAIPSAPKSFARDFLDCVANIGSDTPPARQSAPKPQPQCPDRRPTPAEQEIIDACVAGDIVKVENYLRQFHIQDLGHPYHNYWHPPAHDFMKTAIVHKRASVLECLLKVSPSFDWFSDWYCGDSLLEAVIDDPDLEILQVIYSHDPSFIHQNYNHEIDNLLMNSCRGGNPMMSGFLLDKGADPHNGGLGRTGGPLYSALWNGQPLEIIQKMVKNGARIDTWLQCNALEYGRKDVFRYMLKNGHCPANRLSDQARASEDEEIIAMIDKRARNLTKREKKEAAQLKKQERATKVQSGQQPSHSASKDWLSDMYGYPAGTPTTK
ncbi:MAG: hypothetical protein Q9170_000523 [Blastenia crenularia]